KFSMFFQFSLDFLFAGLIIGNIFSLLIDKEPFFAAIYITPISLILYGSINSSDLFGRRLPFFV
ncbi:MAG: hypothetical protein Q4C52_08895, partial [Eubacteriales bacterium]|nr:hypothetical protein [Eubacteriales bacterium]